MHSKLIKTPKNAIQCSVNVKIAKTKKQILSYDVCLECADLDYSYKKIHSTLKFEHYLLVF